MSYKFLEDAAIADVAFEARGKTLKELFESAALAVTNTMLNNPEEMELREIRSFEVEAADIEMLLFNFLQELIFLKDAQLLLFNRFELDISRHGDKWHLYSKATGDKIDPGRHELIADVKAVALHNFHIEQTTEGWRAAVILDV